METLYIKSGKRYKKIGTTMTTDYQPDGLWLFQSHKYSRSQSNIGCRIQELPQPVEVQEYIKFFLSKEVVIKAIQRLNTKGKIYLSGISLDDAAQAIVDETYLESQKEND